MRYIVEDLKVINGVTLKEGDIIDVDEESKEISITRLDEMKKGSRKNLSKGLSGLIPNTVEYELKKMEDGPLFLNFRQSHLHIMRPDKRNYTQGWRVFNWDRNKIRYLELYEASQINSLRDNNSPGYDIENCGGKFSMLDFNELIFFDMSQDKVGCIATMKDSGVVFAEDLSEKLLIPVVVMRFKITFYKWMQYFTGHIVTLDNVGVYRAVEQFVEDQLESIDRIFI